MAQPRHVAHPRHIAPSRHVADSHSTERDVKACLREAPWVTIALLTLVLILILALWGKLPSRLRLPHQAPGGKSPGGSSLYLEPSFRG
jgi:hypothetical protein